MPRGMRFGLCTDQNLPFGDARRALAALRAPRLRQRVGLRSLQSAQPPDRARTTRAGRSWPRLAARTSRIRIGVLVSCNTFRHPGLLAHEAMTVDHVSNGRLELGLGAGWFVPEHEQFGIPLPPPGELVGRFHEAVQIVDGLLRHGQRHLRREVLPADERPRAPEPRPAAASACTLGAHKSRMLRICAEYADAWNSFGTLAEMRERNQILDEHCAAIGRDPSTIWRSFYGWASKMKEQGLADPWSSVGAFEDMVGRYGEAGVNEFIVDAPGPEHFAGPRSASPPTSFPGAARGR